MWYSVESPDRVTNFPIKGEVEDIERSKVESCTLKPVLKAPGFCSYWKCPASCS